MGIESFGEDRHRSVDVPAARRPFRLRRRLVTFFIQRSLPVMEIGDPVFLRDMNDLRALRANPAILKRRPLIVDLPRLTEEQSQAAAERIGTYAAECGCSMGARCMTAVALCASSWLLYRYGFSAGLLWRLPWTLLTAIIAAGAGKAIGILRARAQLGNEIQSLIVSMDTQEA